MITLFTLIGLVSIILLVPAWFISKRKNQENTLFLFLAIPSFILWFLLTWLGFGAQSLANLSELFFIMAASTVAAYIKVLVIDKIFKQYLRNTYLLIFFLMVFTFFLRLFMPLLPE